MVFKGYDTSEVEEINPVHGDDLGRQGSVPQKLVAAILNKHPGSPTSCIPLLAQIIGSASDAVIA